MLQRNVYTMNISNSVRRIFIHNENFLVFAFMLTFALVILFSSFLSTYDVFASSGFSINLDVVIFLVAVVLGLASSYFILRSFGQEKIISFFEGEEVIFKSVSNGTYAVMVSVDDADVGMSPIHSNIYLTTLGIVVEPKGSGEIALFIPRDMIRHHRINRGGSLVRYIDIKGTYNEILFFVDDINSFSAEVGRMVSQNML
jgi:hypothetical protein